MRKIIVSEMITTDGFFAGPNGEIDWHHVDAEFNTAYAIPMLDAADTFIFGRITYDLMASYWPTPGPIKNDPIVAKQMNEMEKIVFSKTPQGLAWNNSRVLTEIVPAEIEKIKQQPGKDILIFGSGMIVSAFAGFGLIDEYRFLVNPLAIGAGKTLFAGVTRRIMMQLIEEKKFANGNVLLRYKPA